MSMAEEERMPQAKKALKAGLETLNPGDRFNIVKFSTEAAKWKDAPVEVNADNLTSARAFIDGLKARGFVIYAGQGGLSSQLFRISTMGALTAADMHRLLAGFRELVGR